MGKRTATALVHCSRADCGERAAFQVALRVWPMGERYRVHSNCANVLMTISVCDRHRPEVKVEHCLTMAIKEKIANRLMHELDCAVPDFSATQLNFLPIVDKPIGPRELVEGGYAHGESP